MALDILILIQKFDNNLFQPITSCLIYWYSYFCICWPHTVPHSNLELCTGGNHSHWALKKSTVILFAACFCVPSVRVSISGERWSKGASRWEEIDSPSVTKTGTRVDHSMVTSRSLPKHSQRRCSAAHTFNLTHIIKERVQKVKKWDATLTLNFISPLSLLWSLLQIWLVGTYCTTVPGYNV